MSIELWQETPQESLPHGDVQFGWEPRFVGQLVRNARQVHMRELVPEDYRDRFASQRTANKWHGENFDRNEPLIAWVGDSSLRLAGIAWITDNNEFGLRVYEGFEAAKIGTKLALAVHEKFDAKFPRQQTHFKMQTRNTAAFMICSLKLGYQLQDTPTARVVTATAKVLTGNLEQDYIRKVPHF